MITSLIMLQAAGGPPECIPKPRDTGGLQECMGQSEDALANAYLNIVGSDRQKKLKNKKLKNLQTTTLFNF